MRSKYANWVVYYVFKPFSILFQAPPASGTRRLLSLRSGSSWRTVATRSVASKPATVATHRTGLAGCCTGSWRPGGCAMLQGPGLPIVFWLCWPVAARLEAGKPPGHGDGDSHPWSGARTLSFFFFFLSRSIGLGRTLDVFFC